MSFIQVRNLQFDYPARHVLKNVSFEIAAGSITALVGPNGAGKTTLMRCLSGLELPLSGEVVIDGVNVHDHPRQAHRKIGYLSDFFGLYDDLTVRQCLTYMAWSQKIPKAGVAAHVAAVAEEVGITSYLDDKSGSLSRGYRQRLGVGLALIHNPQILLLDEPASGMDPEARIKFSELMLRLRDRGMTMIVSSHILAELEDYCTDMLVLRDGAVKSHVILREHEAQHSIVLEIGISNLNDAQMELIRGYEGVANAQVAGAHVSCPFYGDEAAQGAFLAFLIKKNVAVYSFTPTRKTLKSAYMDLATSAEGLS